MDQVSVKIRKEVLRASNKSGHGHVPTCFSVIESILAVYGVMQHDPKNADWEQRDLFVLSKGHAALGYYCTLSELGYFPIEPIYTFGNYGTTYGCHADRKKVLGVEASTGSLGHGIGLAVGMALANKIQKNDRKVYVLIGDGESNEGTVWESLMIASQNKLDNLCVILDFNSSQGRCLPISEPVEKFSSFGCNVHNVDGHNIEAMKAALLAPTDTVKAIVANTVKGYGCETLVDNVYEWHRRSPTDAQLTQFLEEVDAWAV